MAWLPGMGQTLALRHYTLADGLPQSTLYGLCQDQRGQLWAGTQSGVCWFDGRKFTTLDSRQGLPDNHVTAVAEGPDGTLWFGHRYAGVSYYRGGRARRLPGLTASGQVRQIVPDGPQTLWVATDGSGLFRVAGQGQRQRITRITHQQGLPSDSVNQLLRGPNGAYWAATSAGLVAIDPATNRAVAIPGLPAALSQQPVYKIADGGQGRYWCATNQGLLELSGGQGRSWQLRRYTTADGLCDNRVRAVHKDRRGRVWVVTVAGVSRLDSILTCFAASATPTLIDGINDVLEDREGNLWLAHNGGLAQHLADERFTQFSIADGLLNPEVYSILEVA
ncbi:MAG TPA: two-component regulator propeller domain-containing protein, partial [Hymenobacter sp.]|nr:two-component regulator propeller domain-containing protein [Hymenobacter sp.]